ncbi:MAG: hypothetical protein VX777_03790 [Chlamydiota bacterium]|nr:hypothetical protein [Chlamydiota bacterium]
MESKHPENSNNAMHKPEFIYVGEEYIESEPKGEYRQEDFYESFSQLHDIKPTIAVRVACLIGSMLVFLLSLFMAACVLVSCIFVVGTLGLNQYCKIVLARHWIRFKNFFVIAGGTFVGVFSPLFGLGIVILYFMLKGQGKDQFFSSFMERHVHRG